MLTDITLCHGEGNLGRVCARRQYCQRHAGLLIDMSAQNPVYVSQAQMLCRPSVMMLGEASYATENAYRFFIPVRGV